MFVHTQRDGMTSVADHLRDAGYDVVLNPRGTSARDFAVRERTVVIRPKPTTQPHEGHLVTVEGLLVELFMERRSLNLIDEGEYSRLFANLAGSSRISLANPVGTSANSSRLFAHGGRPAVSCRQPALGRFFGNRC